MQMDAQSPTGETVPPFDASELRRQLGDDDELMAETVQIFLEDCPAQLAAIETAVAGRDGVAIQRAAHSLRGAASNLWASGVVETARTLEHKAKAGDLDGIDEGTERVRSELQRLVSALTDLRMAS